MQSTGNPSGIARPKSTIAGWLRDWWSRVIAGLAFAVVATVTGVVSYTHIEALTLALHQPLMVARLMPLGIDGLIVVGSVALLQAADDQPYLGWLCIGPGAAASLFANVESGLKFGLLAAVWAGVASAGFFLATYTLERWLKAQAGRGGKPDQSNTDTNDERDDSDNTDPCPHNIAGSVEQAAVQSFLHYRDCLKAPLSQRQLSAAFGLSRPKVAELVAPYLPEPSPELSMNGDGSHA